MFSIRHRSRMLSALIFISHLSLMVNGFGMGSTRRHTSSSPSSPKPSSAVILQASTLPTPQSSSSPSPPSLVVLDHIDNSFISSSPPTPHQLSEIELKGLESLRDLLPGLHAESLIANGGAFLFLLEKDIIKARIHNLGTLFSAENATMMALRDPQILLVEESRLDNMVFERYEQLRGLLRSCNPNRIMLKVPAVIYRDWENQTLHVYQMLEKELPTLDMGKVIYQNPQLLVRDWETVLKPRIEGLRLLFPSQDLARMINKSPALLSRDVEGRLKDKLTALSELLPGVDIKDLAEKQPSILGRDLALVNARLDRLRNLLPEADVELMLKRVPTLLLADPEKNLVPKIERLRQLLSPTAASKVCQQMPTIFNRDLDKVEQRLHTLSAHLPGLDVSRFVEKHPGFLREPVDSDISGRLASLKTSLLQPSMADLSKLLAREPRLYAEDPATLTMKLDEVRQVTGLSNDELVSRVDRDARFLTMPYGLLVARLRFLCELLGQEDIQRINLSSLTGIPVKNFFRLYPTYGRHMAQRLAGFKGKGEAAWAKMTLAQLEKTYIQSLWKGKPGK